MTSGRASIVARPLSVARPPEVGDDVETEAVIENSRQYHRRMLAELKSSVAVKGVKTHFEVAVGHPAEQIIFDADRHGAGRIVGRGTQLGLDAAESRRYTADSTRADQRHLRRWRSTDDGGM